VVVSVVEVDGCCCVVLPCCVVVPCCVVPLRCVLLFCCVDDACDEFDVGLLSVEAWFAFTPLVTVWLPLPTFTPGLMFAPALIELLLMFAFASTPTFGFTLSVGLKLRPVCAVPDCVMLPDCCVVDDESEPLAELDEGDGDVVVPLLLPLLSDAEPEIDVELLCDVAALPPKLLEPVVVVPIVEGDALVLLLTAPVTGADLLSMIVVEEDDAGTVVVVEYEDTPTGSPLVE
jgi:hypothetical protein